MIEKIKSDLFQMDDVIIVPINNEVREAMLWLEFKENNLNLTLKGLQENRYGFYDKELVIKTYSDLEDIRLEREELISLVGKALLGDDWRKVLDEAGYEFMIAEELPYVRFFKPQPT